MYAEHARLIKELVAKMDLPSKQNSLTLKVHVIRKNQSGWVDNGYGAHFSALWLPEEETIEKDYEIKRNKKE